jgi:hypothetical protein
MTLAVKKTLVAIALFAVSAAMVYGTWLAVDDMRAKLMVAQVTVDGGAVVVVNDGDFAWSDAQFVVNGTYRAAAPGTLAPARARCWRSPPSWIGTATRPPAPAAPCTM